MKKKVVADIKKSTTTLKAQKSLHKEVMDDAREVVRNDVNFIRKRTRAMTKELVDLEHLSVRLMQILNSTEMSRAITNADRLAKAMQLLSGMCTHEIEVNMDFRHKI